MKRYLAFLLTLVMIVCALPGLAETKFDIKNDYTLPVVDEPVHYTMFAEVSASFESAKMDTYQDSEAYQEWFKRTGVYLDVISPGLNAYQEAYNIMLASGDYPDIVNLASGVNLYEGGIDGAIKDGIYIRLNELVEQYMPNYWALINTNDETRRQAFTAEGNLKGLMNVWIPEQHNWYGYVVRKDWLEDLGLEIPVTYDDWHEMLTRFKNEKGATAPLLLPSNGMCSAGLGASHLANGLNTCDSFFTDEDGKVQWGPVTEGYRKYCEIMHQWYEEGLIDQDFYGRNNNFIPETSLTTTGIAGVWLESYLEFNNRAKQSGDPNYKVCALPDPVEKEGDKIAIWRHSGMINGPTWYITTACKDPVPFLKALDYLYTDDGYHFAQYGTLNDTYEIVDGEPRFTAKIYDNPEGITRDGCLFKYTLKGAPTIYVYSKEKIQMTDDEYNAPDVWDTNITDESRIYTSFATMTSEESERYYQLFDDLDTYVKENIVNFITGARPLSEFDDYVKQCYAMGAQELIDIKQTALDRYMNMTF